LKTMNRLLPREAKVPVASLSVKAKASACGGLDAKFGYHSKLPILESIKNYESKNRLKTVNKNQDGSMKPSVLISKSNTNFLLLLRMLNIEAIPPKKY